MSERRTGPARWVFEARQAVFDHRHRVRRAGELPAPLPRETGDTSAALVCRAVFEEVCVLANGDVDLVTCEVGGLVQPDVTAVGALARLQLTARRSGRAIRLRNARVELCDLLALTGLRDELPVCPGLLAQPHRQSEQREQLRIDEEVDPADPSV